MENLLITVYADFQAMFTAFQAGQIDITDWPVAAADIPAFGCDGSSGNPQDDIFCTNAEGEFGIFQMDFNRHHDFLGQSWLAARPAPVTSHSVVTDVASTCSAPNGRFIMNLENVELGGAPIVDALNKLTVTFGAATKAVVLGNGVNNVYTTPCILPEAGALTIRSSVYRGEFNQVLGINRDVTLDLSAAYNSDSNSDVSSSGRSMGRAIGHLLDKENYVVGPSCGGICVTVDTQTPPAQGVQNLGGPSAPSKLAQVILDEDLAAHTACAAVISAYNCVDDPILVAPWWTTSSQPGRGWSGAVDLEAACDHFEDAGFVIKNGTLPGTCAQLAAISTGAATPGCATNLAAYTCPRLTFSGGKNQIIMYPRTDPRRRDFARIIGDSINFLFGTPKAQANNVVTTCVVNYGYLSAAPGCSFQAYSIGQIFDIVFGIDTPGGSPPGQDVVDDWHLYSGGWSLGSTPDHLWALYHTDFSGGQSIGGCAGTTEGFPLDYGEYCSPLFDTDSAAGQFSGTLAEAGGFFSRAAITAHRNVMTLPVFSLASRFVALNGWNFQPGSTSSLVQQLGHGWQTGFWSLFNMRQVPGYVPNNPIYTPGGTDPLTNFNTIRRGFSQEVHKLSLFHGLTVWDFEVMGQIYDSLLAVNPRTGGANSQVIDWMTTSHSSTFSATEVSTLPDGSSFTGTTTQTWRLRNDIKFQNGAAVTANDVCFSALAFQNVPSSNLQASASTISSCKVLNSKTVQAKHILQSAFYELNFGGLPILPASIWGPLCSWNGPLWDSSTMPSVATLQASTCGNPAYDPMTSGTLIGSGPWKCVSPANVLGGPCSSSGTQDLVLGDTVALVRNDLYHRAAPNLQGSNMQALSWSDADDSGAVNILDIADAALDFGSPNVYWDHPLYGAVAGIVDIAEIARIASLFDHGITKPFAPSALVAMDPAVDPYSGQDIVGHDLRVTYLGMDAARNLWIAIECSDFPLSCDYTASFSGIWRGPGGVLGAFGPLVSADAQPKPFGWAVFAIVPPPPAGANRLIVTVEVTVNNLPSVLIVRFVVTIRPP